MISPKKLITMWQRIAALGGKEFLHQEPMMIWVQTVVAHQWIIKAILLCTLLIVNDLCYASLRVSQ